MVQDPKNYFCGRCRYSFKFSDKPGKKLICPYCGKDDRLVDAKEMSADTLLKEVTDKDFMY